MPTLAVFQGKKSSRAAMAVNEAAVHQTKLYAMAFCRSIMTFLGYPSLNFDPKFINHDHMACYIDVLCNDSDRGKLWDFLGVDLSVIITPIYEFAMLAESPNRKQHPLGDVTIEAVEKVQMEFTVGQAGQLAKELDELAGNGTGVYTKWFQFIRFCEEYDICALEAFWNVYTRAYLIGNVDKIPIVEHVANQSFFSVCAGLNYFIPSWMTFVGEGTRLNQRAIARSRSLSTSSLGHLAVAASNSSGVSSRGGSGGAPSGGMRELLSGSIAESDDEVYKALDTQSMGSLLDGSHPEPRGEIYQSYGAPGSSATI